MTLKKEIIYKLIYLIDINSYNYRSMIKGDSTNIKIKEYPIISFSRGEFDE